MGGRIQKSLAYLYGSAGLTACALALALLGLVYPAWLGMSSLPLSAGLTCCALALAALVASQWGLSLLFALPPAALGAFTVVEYAYHVSDTLDQLALVGSQPRMSPIAGFGLLVFGLALVAAKHQLSRRAALFLPVVLLSLPGTLSLLLLGSHAQPWLKVQEWTGFAPTPLAAVAIFTLLSFGLLGLCLRSAHEQNLSRRRFITGFVGYGLVLCTIAIWQGTLRYHGAKVREGTALRSHAEARTLAVALRSRVRAVEQLAKEVSLAPEAAIRRWDQYAATHHAEFTDIHYFSWIDPQYVLRQIYPKRPGSHAFIGRQLPQEPSRLSTFERARKSGQAAVTPSVTLISGHHGLLITAPVFDGPKLKGYVNGVLRLEDFLGQTRNYAQYDFTIREAGRVIVPYLYDHQRMQRQWAVSSPVPSPYLAWELEMYPSPGSGHTIESMVPLYVLLIGLVLALFFAITLHLNTAAREQAEERAALGRQWQTLAQMAPVGIFRTDAKAEVTYVNEHMKRLVGPVGGSDGWLSAIHPDDRTRVQQDWKTARERQASINIFCRFTSAGNDGLRWVHARAVPLFDARGACLGYLGAVQDFTRQKKAEEDLRESRNFLASVLDNLPVSLFCKDVQTGYSFTLWNRQAERTFGLQQASTLGKTDFDLFPHDQATFFRAKDEETMRNRRTVDIKEEPLQSPTLGPRWLHTTKVPIEDAEGRPRFLLGIAQDITEQKKSQELIERQRLQILHAEKMQALGQMAGGMAHEINNPLAILELCAGQLQSMADQDQLDHATLRKKTETISSTVERIAKIIKGLRSLARDGDSDPIELVPVGKLVEETLEFCLARFGRHGVLVKTLGNAPETELPCRAVQVSQVLLNVLNNAFDAANESTDPWIELETRVSPQAVEFRVKNSGPTIPPEIAARIMQPFFTTKGSRGTGLGLSIAQLMVRAHGGEIYLDSASAHTCFVIKFPRQARERKTV